MVLKALHVPWAHQVLIAPNALTAHEMLVAHSSAISAHCVLIAHEVLLSASNALLHAHDAQLIAP